MGKSRSRIPSKVAAKLLFENQHRCCICGPEPKHDCGPVQIHHIDGNPANNDPRNLAVLDLRHHSEVTGSQGFGRNYSQTEIRLYKKSWEALCKGRYESSNGNSNYSNGVELVYRFIKRVVLGAHEHLYPSLELKAGDEITLNVLSNKPVEFLIMTKPQHDQWLKNGEGMLYEQHTDVTEIDDYFEVPENDQWLLIFCNHSAEEVEVAFSVSVLGMASE
jgi:hypothetical protein